MYRPTTLILRLLRASSEGLAGSYRMRLFAKSAFFVSALGVVLAASASAGLDARVCYPGVTIQAITVPAVTIAAVSIPAVNIPAVTIAAVDIPRSCFGGVCYPAHHYPAQHYPAQHYPAQHYPAQHYPAQHYPAQHYPPTCFAVSPAFAPASTTVRVSGYAKIDYGFSPQLSLRALDRGRNRGLVPECVRTWVR